MNCRTSLIQLTPVIVTPLIVILRLLSPYRCFPNLVVVKPRGGGVLDQGCEGSVLQISPHLVLCRMKNGPKVYPVA